MIKFYNKTKVPST